MSKVKIDYRINDDEKSTIGIKNKNRITFIDECINVKVIIGDDLTIIRENDEYKLAIKLGSQDGCKYTLKGYKDIYIDIEKLTLNIKENKILAIYKLNDEQFSFELNYEVIE